MEVENHVSATMFKYSQHPLGALTWLIPCAAAKGMCGILVFLSPSSVSLGRQWLGCGCGARREDVLTAPLQYNPKAALAQHGILHLFVMLHNLLLSSWALALGILLAWRASPPWEPAQRLSSPSQGSHY